MPDQNQPLEKKIWLEPTGEMNVIDGILILSGFALTVMGLAFASTSLHLAVFGLGICLMLLGFITYGLGRQRAYLTWSDDHIEKVVVSGRGESWSIIQNNLDTVKWSEEQCAYQIFTKDSQSPIKLKGLSIDGQILFGYFLRDTEATEVARPFNQSESSVNSIKKAKAFLILAWLGVIVVIAAYILIPTLSGPGLIGIGGALGPAIMGGMCYVIWNYKRAKLAATIPKLADINREVELEIYEEFGEHAEAAARFYRHIWSHNPQKGWLLLPKATRQRLLAKAQKLK